ncbi:MAG: hypothetical protein SRB2_01329 [Desulfobacteraceae bacterium Eth-SRB2]|nr:MAG: hypothetical protein SRB2_01329 [Desulfobacteraceae bacterium Eth-SRB2]
MATCLCRQNGIMEYWNVGVMSEIKDFNCKKLLPNHHSITPSFHYSNWGEAPKFSYIFSASFKICDVISESVVSILNPAAMEWPPPPKEAAIEATSTVPSERRLT